MESADRRYSSIAKNWAFSDIPATAHYSSRARITSSFFTVALYGWPRLVVKLRTASTPGAKPSRSSASLKSTLRNATKNCANPLGKWSCSNPDIGREQAAKLQGHVITPNKTY
jgi:hypothetical protein